MWENPGIGPGGSFGKDCYHFSRNRGDNPGIGGLPVYRIFPMLYAENPVIFSCAYIGLRKRKKAHRSKCAAKLIDEMRDGNIHNQPPSPKSSDREKKQDQRDVDSHSKDPKDGTPAHRRHRQELPRHYL